MTAGVDIRRWLVIAGLGLVLALFALAIFGPLTNLLLWSVAESWFFPHALPQEYGFSFWERVFRPTGYARDALVLSVVIALLTVVVCLAVSIPAAYALARLKLPGRTAILLLFLLPQAFPDVPIYINIARIFYEFQLNGTVLGVVLVHAVHGLVYSVWIATAAFSAVDHDLEEAARNIGAGPFKAFFSVTLPLAAPGIVASAIFVFLESLDEFTGTYFVGAPDIMTLPMTMFRASMEGNYQIASITALVLLVPSIGFMIVVERVLKADVLSKIGS